MLGYSVVTFIQGVGDYEDARPNAVRLFVSVLCDVAVGLGIERPKHR